MTYDDLLIEADEYNLITKEKPLIAALGRINGQRIAIKKGLPEVEKVCILAEEVGHYHTSFGDILDQSTVSNRKQELKARIWAYNKLIGIQGIISALNYGCRNLNEVSEYLNVSEEFFMEALSCYKSKYGLYKIVDNYMVSFEPLGVLELYKF